MYYENDTLILRDLEDGVKEMLDKQGSAFMAVASRSKSFKIQQYMRKKFPDCNVVRKFNDEVYLISVSEKINETV